MPAVPLLHHQVFLLVGAGQASLRIAALLLKCLLRVVTPSCSAHYIYVAHVRYIVTEQQTNTSFCLFQEAFETVKCFSKLN